MSKIPAKQASPKKPEAKKPTAKAVVKTAAPAKAAKPAPHAAAKPASAKATAKPAPAPVKPHAAARSAHLPATPAHPAAAHSSTSAHPEPAAKPAAPAKPVLEVVTPPPAPPKRSGKMPPAPPAAAPLPPPTSRFADRFAPPRPPTRQMNNDVVDTPKQAHKADPKLANAWKTKAGRDLTEAELMAMPDSEYMNEKQLDFFRARLQALKDDLLSNAGETTEHLREDTSIVPDPADRATIEEEHALELRTRDRERKLLKKISQSLSRIEAGDYGFCDETGEPIGLGRLIARPTATLSLEAQQRRELKQKMFGD